MHPDTISSLASLHQRDLDIEASRAALAKSVQRQPAAGGQRIAGVRSRLQAVLAARAGRLGGRSIASRIPAAIGQSNGRSGPPKARA